MFTKGANGLCDNRSSCVLCALIVFLVFQQFRSTKNTKNHGGHYAIKVTISLVAATLI